MAKCRPDLGINSPVAELFSPRYLFTGRDLYVLTFNGVGYQGFSHIRSIRFRYPFCRHLHHQMVEI